jgi:Mrp family chromosome partitioning ATPase
MTNLVRVNNSLGFRLPVEAGVTRQVEIPNHKVDPAMTVAHRDPALLDAIYRKAVETMLPGETSAAARLFVTSAGKGDGKTCTAVNLASSLARGGKRVLLAELNFSRPRLLAALGNPRVRYGLENALRGWVQPADTIVALPSSGLHISPVRNAIPPDRLPPVLEHLQAFFAWSSERYEIVIFDCPSVLSEEWGDWFGSFAGSALLVVREEHTPQVEVQRAMQLLGAKLKGVLLNGHREAPARDTAPLEKTSFAAPPRPGPKPDEKVVAARSVLRTGS